MGGADRAARQDGAVEAPRCRRPLNADGDEGGLEGAGRGKEAAEGVGGAATGGKSPRRGAERPMASVARRSADQTRPASALRRAARTAIAAQAARIARY